VDLTFTWGSFAAPADDYTPTGKGHKVIATVTGEEAGYAEMIVVNGRQPNDWLEGEYLPGQVYVHWVETSAACRRQGVAKALLSEVQQHFSGKELVTGGFASDEGEALWSEHVEG
jgi:ribosomal protein S18 acetylase RimI-like enzyme